MRYQLCPTDCEQKVVHIDVCITSRLGRSGTLFMPFRLAKPVAFVSESTSNMLQRRESFWFSAYILTALGYKASLQHPLPVAMVIWNTHFHVETF